MDSVDRFWIAGVTSGSRGSMGSHVDRVDHVDRADQGLDPNGCISPGMPSAQYTFFFMYVCMLIFSFYTLLIPRFLYDLRICEPTLARSLSLCTLALLSASMCTMYNVFNVRCTVCKNTAHAQPYTAESSTHILYPSGCTTDLRPVRAQVHVANRAANVMDQKGHGKVSGKSYNSQQGRWR